MKKILSFALALAMALSLAACGGGDNSPATSSAQQESSASSGASSSAETPDASQPADGSQEADSSQVEDQPQTDVVPTFDPNWADAEHPLPIPAPPFQCEVEFDDRGRCTIRSTDVDEISGMPLDTIIDYCETVKALGYSNSLQENVLETGRDRQGYEFYGEMEGSCVMLMDDAFGCMIMVIVEE